MTVELAITLLILGTVGGFFSGWLGIGGGIIMAPLLLYLPDELGVASLDMKTVAGLTMAQSLFATGSAVIVHRRFSNVNSSLVLWLGISITIATLAGAMLSASLPAEMLMGIFAVLALTAGVLMLGPIRETAPMAGSPTRFSRPVAVAGVLPLGFLGGLVGQSGAFILIPFMLYVLRVPTREAIGSSLGIVFLAAVAGTSGKLVTGQIEIIMALFCIIGALAGAQLGGFVSQRTTTTNLRRALAVIIIVAAIRMVVDIADV